MAAGRDSVSVDSDAVGPEQSDVQLLNAVGVGDQVALRELYERHQAWLVARLRHRCTDPDVVDECLQDTFVAVWKGASRYEGTGEVAAWMWGIAIRRLIGVLRKQPRPIAFVRDDTVMVSAEDHVLSGVQYGDLAGALGGLSPELRAVVQATVLDGLTTREAGRLLGIPAGTVKTRMMRARQELRGALT